MNTRLTHGFFRGNPSAAPPPPWSPPAAPDRPQWRWPVQPSPVTSRPAALLPLPIHPPRHAPQLLFFFRKFPGPTQSYICSVQRKNKTKNQLKSQNTKRIACFASRNLLASSPETSSHPLTLLLRRASGPSGGGALTAPAQTCPAGPQSGPPSHSPPAAAPQPQSWGAAWRQDRGPWHG